MEIKTFDGPGRGRKPCDCGKYVGIRTRVCACGYTFSNAPAAKEVPEKVITTYEVGGPGKKQCGACKLFVGAKNKVCACGNEFTFKKKVAPVPVVTASTPEGEEESKPRMVGRIVIAPSGTCPVKLEGTDEQDVRVWISELRTKYQSQGVLSEDALKQYARQFVNINDRKYQKVCQVIETA